MPLVTDYADGARFVVRTRKHLLEQPSVKWFNTYEFRSTSAGGYADITDLARVVSDFEQDVMYNFAVVDQTSVSSWEPDSHPYNPLAFAIFPMEKLGENPLGVRVPTSLRETVYLSREVEGGRVGKLFLRACLATEDVIGGGPDWTLASPVPIQADVNAALTSSGLSLYLSGIESPQFGMCLLGDSGETRFISNLIVRGCVDVKMNHKYFDRAPTP